MLETVQETANFLSKKLDDHDPFYFLRFGDGDLTLIDGASHEQRHRNSEGLRRELHESLVIYDDRYVVSSTAGAYNDGSGSYFWIDNEAVKRNLDNRLINYWNKFRKEPATHHALVFQYMMEYDMEWFCGFVNKCFGDQPTLFLGGSPLCNNPLIEKMFNIKETVEFSGLKDSYYSLDNKMDEILDKLEKCIIVLPVIGMGTRVLAKRLWSLGVNKTVMDIGVTIDALAEATHRGWTRRVVEQGVVNRYKERYL